MKKASIRLLSAVLAILMLCAIAGCAPSTDDKNPSTEQTTTTNSTENTTTDSTENTTTESTEGSNPAVLYENSFASSADMEGWTNNPAEIPEGSYAKVNDAGQLEIYVATKDATGRSFNLEGYSGKVTFEFDITCGFLETVDGNRTSGAFMVFADGKAAVCFYFYPEGFGYYNNNREPSPGVTIFGTCNGDQTYHVVINADTDADTYDVYVDGELILEDAGFRNAGEKFNKIQLSSGGNSVGVTLKYDNLKIYVTEE